MRRPSALLLAAALLAGGCSQRQIGHTTPKVHLQPAVEAGPLLDARYALMPLIQRPYSLRWHAAYEAAAWQLVRRRDTGDYLLPPDSEDRLVQAGAWAAYGAFADAVLSRRRGASMTPVADARKPGVMVRSPAPDQGARLPREVLRALEEVDVAYAVVPVLHPPTAWIQRKHQYWVIPPAFWVTYDESYLGDVVHLDFLLLDAGSGELLGAVTGVVANERDAVRAMSRALRYWRQRVREQP